MVYREKPAVIPFFRTKIMLGYVPIKKATYASVIFAA
jgi:hypothetical protein